MHASSKQQFYLFLKPGINACKKALFTSLLRFVKEKILKTNGEAENRIE